MAPFLLLLALLIFALAYAWALSNKRVRILQGRLQETIPHLQKAGLDFDELKPFLKPFDWVQIAQGGNNQAGNIGRIGFCPCQKEYTVNTRQTNHQNRPNAQQIQNCMNNPPPTQDALWKCGQDCVQVKTHVWHGWSIVRHRRTGQFRLNCNTFAQYHCKKPDDPAADEEPSIEPPMPDIEL